MDAEKPPVDLPSEVWDDCRYTSVHTTILAIDIEDRIQLVSSLPPPEYNALIDRFQALILDQVESFRREFHIAETIVSGGRARIYLYDPEEVQINIKLDGPDPLTGTARNELIEKCRDLKETLAFEALKLAIQLNISWLSGDANLKRAQSHVNPWLIGIGIHTGRAYLTRRRDGKIRIEGNAIELAERVLGLCGQARYSHVLVSSRTREYLSRMVRIHTQLRQRLFFFRHKLEYDQMKGFIGDQEVFELRFFHLIGVHLEDSEVPGFEAIFNLNRSNTWAYNLLADHFGYVIKDWQKMYQIARRAHLAVPDDEKVLHDLAMYFLKIERTTLAVKFAEEALKINPAFDIAWELLARIAHMQGDKQALARYWREAVYLNPDSPVNNFNLGLALLELEQSDEGYYFVQEALRNYPEYADSQMFRETLLELKNKGRLPKEMEIYLEYIGEGDS